MLYHSQLYRSEFDVAEVLKKTRMGYHIRGAYASLTKYTLDYSLSLCICLSATNVGKVTILCWKPGAQMVAFTL